VKRFWYLAALLAVAAPAISRLGDDGPEPVPGWMQGEGTLTGYKAAKVTYMPGLAYDDAVLLVRGGKVAGILKKGEALPPFLEVVDLGQAQIMPGLVAADSPLTGNGNQGDLSMAADRRAFDDFDPYMDMGKVLERGITTMYLSPDRRRLMGGRGAVMKTAGAHRVLKEVSDLRVSLLPSAQNPPVYYRPPIPPTSENPVGPAEVQAPQTRAGAMLALRESAASSHLGASDAHSKALADFLHDKGTLRVAANQAGEIRGALELAHSWGSALVVDGATEADVLASALGEARASVVFHPPLFTSLPDLGSDWQPPAADVLRKLRDVGVGVALSPDEHGRWTWLFASAAASMAYGLTEDEALAGITKTPAELLGVADRVGSLGEGKDADFLVLSGAPLDPATGVIRVYIEGDLVWDRRDREQKRATFEEKTVDATAVVIRAGTLWPGDGAPITGGVEVLLKNGKVVAAGHRVPHPAGARLLDAGSRAHLTPGFIDARSTHALSSRVDASAILGLLASNSRQDESWLELARGGITTAVIGPSGINTTGVLATAVKTAAGPGAEAYIDGHQAVLLDLRTKNLQDLASRTRGTLKSGKAYFDKWEKYRADRAKWQTEKAAKEATARTEKDAALRERLAKGAAVSSVKKEEVQEQSSDEEVVEEAPQEVDPINGLWEGTIEDERIPEPVDVNARMFHEGDTLTGVFSSPMAPGETAELEGTWDADSKTARFEITQDFGTIVIEGVIDAEDHMSVHVELAGMGGADFEMTRTEVDSGPAKAERKKVKKDDGPSAPKIDSRMEGMRALYEGRAVALVYADQAMEIRTAIEVFTEAKMPLQIVGGREADQVADLMREHEVGVIAPSTLVVRKGNADVVPAVQLQELGLAVAFQSGSGGRRAAMLPQALTMTTRYGLGAEQILHSLTAGAAQMLGLQHRVGRLLAGLDGDLLVHDGPPFDLRTRITHVFVNGREVPAK
jgi:imidazolonepropionase-like amidohydrolase